MDIFAIIYYSCIITDIIVGDPKWIIHPTQIIGRVIIKLEALLRFEGQPPIIQRLTGFLLVVIVVAGTYTITYYVLRLCLLISPVVALGAKIWLLSTTIAIKGLSLAGYNIYRLLIEGNLQEARLKLGEIVGRDTENLPETEIVRGTVETIAENTVDGIIAPLFFALLGGVPLAMAYRATNTLDSMLGYKNERYRHFGTAAARLDDIANFLPARLTGLFMVAASFALKLNYKKAWQTIVNDANKHPSPNSGIPEAATAGALGIRLGGTNFYQGNPSFRAFLGEEKYQLGPNHIKTTILLMAATTALFAVLSALVFLAPWILSSVR
jgi:adenosylcobinamide-phosphate synthase